MGWTSIEDTKIKKIYRWTVDVEFDEGGRTNGTRGLTEGLPKIIRAFNERGIKALFFVSTEIKRIQEIIEEIRREGHEVGSHGHFHTTFREGFRKQADKDLSYLFLEDSQAHYRAPKFNFETKDRYSQKKGHISLLRHMWLKEKIRKDTIIYLHPFDIVEHDGSPNLFCKLWYSRPKRAYETFINLLSRYPDSYIS